MQKRYHWYDQPIMSTKGILCMVLFMTAATILMLAIALLA